MFKILNFGPVNGLYTTMDGFCGGLYRFLQYVKMNISLKFPSINLIYLTSIQTKNGKKFKFKDFV